MSCLIYNILVGIKEVRPDIINMRRAMLENSLGSKARGTIRILQGRGKILIGKRKEGTTHQVVAVGALIKDLTKADINQMNTIKELI